MSENIKIKSTTMGGASHAFEFRGQFKWIAIAATLIIMSGVAAITVIALRAIDRCAAPCFIEASNGRVVLAPAGELVAQEIRLIGAIPAPHRHPPAPLPAANIATAPVAALDAPRPARAGTTQNSTTSARSTPVQRAAIATPAKATVVQVANNGAPSPNVTERRQPKPGTATPAQIAVSERMHVALWRTIDRP